MRQGTIDLRALRSRSYCRPIRPHLGAGRSRQRDRHQNQAAFRSQSNQRIPWQKLAANRRYESSLWGGHRKVLRHRADRSERCPSYENCTKAVAKVPRCAEGTTVRTMLFVRPTLSSVSIRSESREPQRFQDHLHSLIHVRCCPFRPVLVRTFHVS